MNDNTMSTNGTAATLSTDERIMGLEAKLDGLSAQVQLLVDAQRPIVELAREVGPIADEVMAASIEQLSKVVERGYLDIATEAKYLLDRLVEDYDPSDLHDLADNAANILDTVRMVTQPSVMAVVRDAAESFDGSADLEPLGPIAALRRIKKDKNIQRGFAFFLDVMSRTGRAVARAPRPSRSEARSISNYTAPPTRSKPARPPTDDSVKPAPAPEVSAEPRADDTFVPDAEWDRTYCTRTAVSYGVTEFTDGHWQLVEFVRGEYLSCGLTPNIRKISKLSGTPTREIYTLFPKAPGKVMAAIAGVPKPAGCL